jgi:hypothetical protein
MRLFRIFLSLLLLLVGALLGDGYKNNLFLYWLLTAGFLVIYAEFLTNTLINIKGELDTYKDKVSSLTMLKGNGGSFVQMSINPTRKIIVGQETQIDIYTTFATPVTNAPDLKIKTDIEWEIKISNQIQHSKNFAGKYEYILNNPLVGRVDDKFVKYSFFVTIYETGNHKFIVELDNGDLKNEISNSLSVHSI